MYTVEKLKTPETTILKGTSAGRLQCWGVTGKKPVMLCSFPMWELSRKRSGMVTGMEKLVFKWRNLFLNSKKYCKWLFKNICSSLWGSSFTSGKFRVPLHASKRFLPPSIELLQGHWVQIVAEAPQPSQGQRGIICQSLIVVDCPPRELSLLSRAQKTSRAISQLLCSFPDEFQCQASKT